MSTRTTQDDVIAVGNALVDLARELLKTPPGRLLLRFVDWCPGIQRRPWARDL